MAPQSQDTSLSDSLKEWEALKQTRTLSDLHSQESVERERSAESLATTARTHGLRPLRALSPPGAGALELTALPQGLRPPYSLFRAVTSPFTGFTFLSPTAVTSSSLSFLPAVFGNRYNRISAKVPLLFTALNAPVSREKKYNSSRTTSPQFLRRLQTPNRGRVSRILPVRPPLRVLTRRPLSPSPSPTLSYLVTHERLTAPGART